MTTLSDSEKAYFESGGAVDPVAPVEKTEDETTQDAVVTDAQIEQPAEQSADPEKKQGMVPHGALHAEREERKKAEARANELEARAKEKEDTLNKLLDRFKSVAADEHQAPVDDDPEPDPQIDIFEHSKWQSRQLAKMREAFTQQQQVQQQQAQEAQRSQALMNHWENDVQDFSLKTPDFQQAATFMAEKRHKELEAQAWMNPQLMNPKVRDQIITNEVLDVVSNAAQAGQSAANYIYRLAQLNGYQAKTAPPAPVTPPVDATQKIEGIAKAQAASKSLSQAKGGATSEPDAETILAMTDKQLKAFLAKEGNQDYFNRLLGAR